MTHPQDLWAAKIQDLEKPLGIWLRKSYLAQSNKNDCVLFVDKQNYLLLQNFLYISKIYSIIKTIYPDFRSLHIAESSLLVFLRQSKIELYSIEV